MQLVGLTGGIATGKSTAAAYLKQQGIPVIDADVLARRVLDIASPSYLLACKAFPSAVDENGELNRGKLADIIFQDKAAKKRLERIVHPAVRFAMVKAICWYWFCGYDRVILDIPLLFETHLDKWMSYTVVISATKELQKQRLMARNHLSEEQVESRIASQMSTEDKCKLAQCVVSNMGDIDELYRQLDELIVERVPNPLLHSVLFHAIPLLGVFMLVLLGLGQISP